MGGARVGIEGGRWAWAGQGKVVVGKWKQLYLNINKKTTNKAKPPTSVTEVCFPAQVAPVPYQI